MVATIQVNKQSIKQLLETAKEHTFFNTRIPKTVFLD